MEPENETKIADKQSTPMEEDTILKEMLRVDVKYLPLLTLLEQFSPGEDGIQFKIKLQRFETAMSSMCPDETQVHQAFATLRAAALLNSKTARKLAFVGAFFTREQTDKRQPLLKALLNLVLQDTYFKLDTLKLWNPIFLINAANLMADYFAEARLCDSRLAFLARPLLQYMRALLGIDDMRAQRCLLRQFYQHRSELQSILGRELEELSNSIDHRLQSSPAMRDLWMVLCADHFITKVSETPARMNRRSSGEKEGPRLD